MSQYTVFVSHSSADTWIARAMAERIRSVGARVWLDEKDLDGGDVVLTEVLSGISASNELVVLVSPPVLDSDWVKVEIGMALGQNKRVTPFLSHVKYDDIKPIATVKSIELNNFERFVGPLEKRVSMSR